MGPTVLVAARYVGVVNTTPHHTTPHHTTPHHTSRTHTRTALMRQTACCISGRCARSYATRHHVHPHTPTHQRCRSADRSPSRPGRLRRRCPSGSRTCQKHQQSSKPTQMTTGDTPTHTHSGQAHVRARQGVRQPRAGRQHLHLVDDGARLPREAKGSRKHRLRGDKW